MGRLAVACAFFFLSFHANAQTYFSCDFEKGIPADFTLQDYDQNEPSASMKKIGFGVGLPWISVATNKAETNHAACSTSWYAKAGTSDDWMITPVITLTGENPVISWKAMAADAKHADGYAVYLSTDGGTDKSSFDMANPLYSVSNEEADWVEHTISLKDYVGKSIRVAFVNNSTDCSRLYVDDITVAEYHKVTLVPDLNRFVNKTGELSVGGTVSTKEAMPINGFTIGVEAQGETTTQHFSAEVATTAPVKFTLDRKLTIGKHETIPYKIWVEADGDRQTQESFVTSYPQKAVCEEGTGTWCGWCVRGLVMLDSIKKNYPDRIIGIAAHSGDKMKSDYVSKISQYLGSSYPTGSVNRRQKCDPKDFIRIAETILNLDEIFSDIDLTTAFDKQTRTVTATTTLHFAEAQKDNNLALAYAILENAVHQPGDDNYRQHNSYANGEAGVMGGYEKYGEYIPSEVMFYNDVARGFVDNLLGIDGSVPQDVEAEQAVVDKRTFTLPDNIFVDDNVEIVVMLIDKTDGRIVNAQNVALVPGGSSDINGVKDNSQTGKTIVYSLNGVRLNGLERGINIVRTSDGRIVKVIK